MCIHRTGTRPALTALLETTLRAGLLLAAPACATLANGCGANESTDSSSGSSVSFDVGVPATQAASAPVALPPPEWGGQLELGGSCPGRLLAQPAGCWLEPAGMPFVSFAGRITDGTSAAVPRSPRSGSVCLSGFAADPGPHEQNWGAALVLVLSAPNAALSGFDSVFDSRRLGISQLRFSVQNPPASGVAALIAGVTELHCDAIDACIGSDPFQPQGADAVVTRSGARTTLLDAYVRDRDGARPRQIFALEFAVGATPGAGLAFDFCVQDLAFLDARGNEVTPAEH